MTRICWWLVDFSSQLLEPGEREVVLGDLAESGKSGGQALRDVLGLIGRRQAALWKGWRPWLALVGFVVPFCLLLCLVSRRMADTSAIYVWLYGNNMDWTLLGNAAFRHDFAHYFSVVFIGYLTLFCWSWTSGFALGSVSRGSLPVNGVLFVLILFCGEFLGAPPRYLGHALFYRARDFPGNAAVFEMTFYRVMFPLIVQVVLVLIPSLWGMRQVARVASLRPVLRIILRTAAVISLAAIAIQNWAATWNGSEARLLQLVVYWPVGYLAASAIGRSRRVLAPNTSDNRLCKENNT